MGVIKQAAKIWGYKTGCKDMGVMKQAAKIWGL